MILSLGGNDPMGGGVIQSLGGNDPMVVGRSNHWMGGDLHIIKKDITAID